MNFILDKIVLFPYYITLKLRHLLYDRNILKSYVPQIPTICVGNITVGGTGKTPMVELLIRVFKQDYRIAVVSRGYKRRTNDLRDVSPLDSYLTVGDEPLQIKKKFPDVRVMVDANRKRAITYLQALPEHERPTLIILDDAFQHRNVRPSFSIVLVNSLRPIFKDSLLPFGRLRDLPGRIRRADMVIVTKMERDPEQYQRDQWRKDLKLSEGTPLLFSKTVYQDMQPVFPQEVDKHYQYAKAAVLFTGIANDTSIKLAVQARWTLCKTLKFPDHHDFTPADFKEILSQAKAYPMSLIMTTEKDAQRLVGMSTVPVELKKRMYYLPIESEIIPETLPHNVLEQEIPGYGINELRAEIDKMIIELEE